MFSYRDRYLKALKKAFSFIRESLFAMFRFNRWVGFTALSLSVVGLLVLGNGFNLPVMGAGRNTTGIGEFGRTHRAVDWATINPAKESQMVAKVEREQIGHLARSRFATNSGSTNTRLAAATPDLVGKWSQVFDWPVVGVHATLMANGKVLAWDTFPGQAGPTDIQETTRVTIWDPATNTHTAADNNTKANLFCSAHTTLADGRVFTAGGNRDNTLAGITKTHTFNPSNSSWRVEGNLQVPRWYPAVTTTSRGEVLITGGVDDPPQGGLPTDRPEVRATNGSLRVLNGAASQTASNRNYSWLRQAPNGKIAYLGPAPQLRYLDVNGNGAWSDIGNRDGVDRSYGSFAMYAPGKVLVAGGDKFNSSAVVVDLNSNTTAATSSMAFQRRQHNLTILADGQVLATGGFENSTQFLVDVNKGVYPAEVWNPANGQWKTLASMDRTRQYHSTALLLPDGRVLSAGGGLCGECSTQNYLQKNAEIFSPPYLFKQDGSGQLANRPTIAQAPGSMRYNSTYGIQTPNARRIKRVSLVRFGGVTHSVNMGQQYQALNFSVANDGRINVVSPNNSRIAPPGRYMMFVVDEQGVPSVAKLMRLS
jgi:hypothetical protein